MEDDDREPPPVSVVVVGGNEDVTIKVRSLACSAAGYSCRSWPLQPHRLLASCPYTHTRLTDSFPFPFPCTCTRRALRHTHTHTPACMAVGE